MPTATNTPAPQEEISPCTFQGLTRDLTVTFERTLDPGVADAAALSGSAAATATTDMTIEAVMKKLQEMENKVKELTEQLAKRPPIGPPRVKEPPGIPIHTPGGNEADEDEDQSASEV